MALEQTPARFIEDQYGGCRALTEEHIPALLSAVSSYGMLDVTVEYVRYRRPDLDAAIRANLSKDAT